MFILLFFIILNTYSYNALAINSIDNNFNTLNGIRIWPSPDNTRLVFDLSQKPEYKDFTLDKPERIVIDLYNTRIQDKQNIKNIIDKTDWKSTEIKKLRYSAKKNNRIRIVLDLNHKVNYKVFDLLPNGTMYGNRLVMDLKSNNNVNNSVSQISTPKKKRKYTVIIDPGHGGEDPGAIGARGTKEKYVVLKIAKYLNTYINNDPELKSYLTRSGDYYVGLRDRTTKAREKEADLFVSIHADGFRDRRARGSSVYVLSERGASSEQAKWTAQHENAADLVGGVSLDNKDPVLASVLLDLSQTVTKRVSSDVAEKILNNMKKVSYMHKNNIEKAGFVVLKSPDIPSVLVETGFISNYEGEKNLRSSAHQRKLAYAIYKGIKQYYKTQKNPWSDYIMHAKN